MVSTRDPRQDPDYITQEMLADAAEATGYDDIDEDRVRSALHEYDGVDAAALKRRLQAAETKFDRAGGRGVALAEEIDTMRIAIAARRRSIHHGHGNMASKKRSSRSSRRSRGSRPRYGQAAPSSVRYWAHGTIEKKGDSSWAVFLDSPKEYTRIVEIEFFPTLRDALRNLERISREHRLSSPSKTPPVHLLTDWNYIACRKGAQRGQISGSRSPSDVTCPKCREASPHLFDRHRHGD